MSDFDYFELLKKKQQASKHISYKDLTDCYNTAVGSDCDYYGQHKFILCPEPYTIIKKFDEYENNINACCMIMADLVKSCKYEQVIRPNYDSDRYWFNSSRNGLNLRAGFLNYQRDNLMPVRFDSEKKSSMLLLGQAGAGKTELLHALFFNVLREYSPWEVQPYLVNFNVKDKEYSEEDKAAVEEKIRAAQEYLGAYSALCEDYNEVRDVIKLLTYANMCAEERIRLFSRAGVENIKEFLEKIEKRALNGENTHLLLPRKVFFIDRMYAVMNAATAKEAEILNGLIESLQEKGSKSGIHIVLSCRDMSNRWSDKAVEGFSYVMMMKNRVAVSKRFLGSEEAVSLLEGEVLIKDLEKEELLKCKSPFIGVEKIDNIVEALSDFRKYSCERFSFYEEDSFQDVLEAVELGQKSFEVIEGCHLSFEELSELTAYVEKKNNTLYFDDFQDGFIRVLNTDKRRFKKEIKERKYEGAIFICPEPFSFLSEYDEAVNKSDMSELETQDIYWQIFENDLRNNEARYRRIELTDTDEEYLWFNRTDKGINLRPGLLNNNKNNPFAVTMGNEFVHGLIVGRTGAGKSVFLNNIIFNLLMEYAPWELDLFLVDFKKVELSRYMSKGVTPHVNACAATSEVRYVVSMIEYLVQCMNARQKFFSRLGVKDIASFREKVKNDFGIEIVLPRVLLLVDEFQQMFLEATNAEAQKIDDMLTAITKLGRATGYHLLFASQEMSSTLSGNVFANFKIRFALLCESEISSSILGNSAASKIKIGEVLLNTDAGAEEDNKLYKVPFIDDKREEFFYSYLRKMRTQCEKYGFDKSWKYYDEDRKDKIEVLMKLNNKLYPVKKNVIESSGGRYKDVVVLGSPVVFNNKKTDWETFFIEKGSGKNIIAVSPNVDDLVYIQKMLMVNLGASVPKYQHWYFSFNPIIRNKYKIEKDVRNGSLKGVYTDIKLLATINETYKFKMAILNLINKVKQDDVAFAKGISELPGVTLSDENKEKYFGEDFRYDKIPEICRANKDKQMLINILKCYYNYRVNGENEIFEPTIVWISGCENIGMVLDSDTLKNASAVNMMFISFTTSLDDMDIDFRLSNDYIFVGGNVENFYDKFDVPYTKKDMESIVIDFKIKSLNTSRSFKKFAVDFGESVAPFIDFDALKIE